MTGTRVAALPPGLTPRLLGREAAAAYCGMSAGHFDAHCPVKPHEYGKRKLWDVRALDRWIDQGSGLDQPYTSNEEWLGALDGDPHERH